jgi:hypothetical protein
MATFNFGAGETNYTGEVLEELLTLTAQKTDTFAKGLIHVEPQIQKQLTLPSIKLGKIIQDRKPTPDSSVGEYSFAERYLAPKDFMIYLEFNPREFERYYKAFQPVDNLVFRKLDPYVQAKMLRLLMEGKEAYIDQAIWCSATATQKTKIANSEGIEGTSIIGAENEYGQMKYWDGAIARMLMNANAEEDSEDKKSGDIMLAGNGSFANGEAVETELYNMYHKLPPKIRAISGLKILMDYNTWDMYDQYLTAKEHKYVDNTQINARTFKGKQIIPMVAFPDNTIIIGKFSSGRDSNLWMSVDMADDINVIQCDKLQNNSELYFFKALMKIDVNIVKPSEIIAHLPYKYTK